MHIAALSDLHGSGRCFIFRSKAILWVVPSRFSAALLGHPLGSAILASAAELYFAQSILCIPDCHVAFVHFFGIRIRPLEIRYADNMSQAALLPSSVNLPDYLVLRLLRERLESLYQNGMGAELRSSQGSGAYS